MQKWFIEREVPGAHIGARAIVDAEGFTVCEPSPMGEANARLIAAAPAMLAALEASEGVLSWLADQGNAAAPGVRDMVRAAIATATGAPTDETGAAAPTDETETDCASCGAPEGESHGAGCEARGFAIGVAAAIGER